MPDFEIFMNQISDKLLQILLPVSIDDSKAKDDWGLSYDFDITTMTREMLENLKIKLKK